MTAWGKMSSHEAEMLANYWDEMSDDEFKNEKLRWKKELETDLSDEFVSIRKKLLEIYNTSLSYREGISKYKMDLYFGLEFYDYSVNKLGLTPVIASDDSIWRYLQLKVVPEITLDRWKNHPQDRNRINDERLWKNKRRTWLKTIWWYIHLSYQGSIEETYDVLKTYDDNSISQLVERTGIGYRVELYRCIMRKCSIPSDVNSCTLLNQVLKLNVFKCATIEPTLYPEGIEAYVDLLISYFGD